MRYLALACDYDGTLARDGVLDDPTFASLERVRESGRKLVLVTGRGREDLENVCPRLEVFDWIVAENGAFLYHPATRQELSLAKRPPEQFIEALKHKGVQPISVGRAIVATGHPFEDVVLETIRQSGLELQVIFNKGAVMILPSGVNKATGLQVALQQMGLSWRNVAAIGDAENDHALLAACEASAAVANAVPLLKQHADVVTEGDYGTGVRQFIEMLLADDLASIEPRPVT